MKNKKIDFRYKGKGFKINLKVCNFFERFSGLMFCPRQKARALLFKFKKPVNIKIHSLFVFFPFIALWLDDKNQILCLKVVKPFTFSIGFNGKFKRFIEIPLNLRYKEIIKLLVGNSSYSKHLKT